MLIKKTLVAGTIFGAASLVGGVAVQWSRLQPHFEPPAPSVFVLPSQAEIAKRQAALEAQRLASVAATETPQLQALLTAAGQKYAGRVAIVATDLKTGATATVNAHDQMVSASLYKLFVGWGIYQMIDTGKISMNSRADSTGTTVGDCMDAMITVSDNDCGYALGALVGWANLDAKLANLGLTQTKLNNYGRGQILVDDKYTSAADVALFTQKLWDGQLLTRKSTDAYLELLKADELNTWLPAGLPPGTPIAHKTGALYDVVHDAGVVYAPNGEYLIVVMSRGWDNASTQPPGAFADISRQLWVFFTSVNGR